MTVIRQPVKIEKAAVRRMWEDCFPEGGPRYVDWYFGKVYHSEWTLGLFDGSLLLSSLQMIPYTLRLRGSDVRMDTLTGVATDAAYRKMGYAKTLMAEALSDMAARGLGFTFLYPFNHDFYKRLGWETCSSVFEHITPALELPDALPPGWAARKAGQRDIPAFSSVYGRFMAGRGCFSARSGAEWMKRIGENKSNDGVMLLASFQGEPSGYAFCEEQNGEIVVGEMAWTREDAVSALLSALKPGGKAACWISPDDGAPPTSFSHVNGNVRLQQYVMFRVTDVPLAFAQAAPACEGEIAVEVRDDGMRPENNGQFLIKATGGKVSAERTDREACFACDIGALAWMLTGFMDAGEIVAAKKATGSDEAVALLTRMYPKQRNYLFELY